MPRNHGDSLMLIPQCFSNNYIWFINVVFRDEHLSNPFSILSAMLTATFLHLGCFLNNLEITLPWSELHTLLLHEQIRWKLKPEEDLSKLKHTMEGKIFPKTVILVRLLMHLTFAFSGFLYLNKSGFGHTAPWLRWFQDSLRPAGWDQPLCNLTNLRSAFSRSCSTQGKNSPRQLGTQTISTNSMTCLSFLLLCIQNFCLIFFSQRKWCHNTVPIDTWHGIRFLAVKNTG